MTLEQQVLLTEIRKLFRARRFDASSVLRAVSKWSITSHPELDAAIKGVTPQCRQHRTRERVLRQVLTELADKGYFTTDEVGWWYVVDKE